MTAPKITIPIPPIRLSAWAVCALPPGALYEITPVGLDVTRGRERIDCAGSLSLSVSLFLHLLGETQCITVHFVRLLVPLFSPAALRTASAAATRTITPTASRRFRHRVTSAIT
jgi:hypothetical protein